MYNNATVIRLAPSTPVVSSSGVSRVSSVRSATFEEAFGEYSELRGKRRQKRQDRRMDKIEARRERRKAREEARREKKLGRVQTRDEVKSGRRLNRQRRRTDVMEARQDRRTGRMEKVQDRRTARKGKRLERRELGREEDERDDLGTGASPSDPIDRPSGGSDSQGGGGSDSQSGGGYADEQGGGGYADEQGGGGYADEQGGGGYADEQGGGGYADEQGGGYADEQGGGGYADEQGGGYADEQGGGDDSGEYSDEQEMGDYGAEEEGYDYSEPFDGIPVDASFSEMDDSGKASKKVAVNPKLQDLVNKIEWNKELVSRLEDKRKKGVANPSDTSKSIIERRKRIAELESQLEMYLGFNGYSMASGMSERELKNEVARRRMEVNTARRRASAIRNGSKNERAMADMTNRRLRAKMGRNHGGDVTPVDVDLKPEIGSNRIVVPSEESSMATGIIGLDDAGDFDARELDIKLSADGDMPMRQPFSMAEGDFYYGGDGDKTKSTSGRSINWTGVVLGIGAGALAIWAIRKYKIIK
jgi:hypothetical protein